MPISSGTFTLALGKNTNGGLDSSVLAGQHQAHVAFSFQGATFTEIGARTLLSPVAYAMSLRRNATVGGDSTGTVLEVLSDQGHNQYGVPSGSSPALSARSSGSGSAASFTHDHLTSSRAAVLRLPALSCHQG